MAIDTCTFCVSQNILFIGETLLYFEWQKIKNENGYN